MAKAVSPDNVEVPSGLFVKTARRRSKVFTTVECQTKLQTFIATIDDLLSCVSVSEKAFSVAKKVQDAPKQLGALSFALSSVA